MKISKITKKRGLYCVMFDQGEELIVLSEELLYSLSWKEGKEVCLDEVFFEKLEKDRHRQCFHLALRKLDYSPLSSFQLSSKLKREGFSEKEIRICLSKLEEMKFIDDSSLSNQVVQELMRRSASKELIRKKLYEKGLSSVGEEAISFHVTAEKEEENAYRLARKKLNSLKTCVEQEKKKKLYQFLAYRGFPYETVSKVVERLLTEERGEEL